MNYRALISHSIRKLGPKNSAAILKEYDALAAKYDEHTAIDLLNNAFMAVSKRIQANASTDFSSLLNPLAKSIYNGILNAKVEVKTTAKIKDTIDQIEKQNGLDCEIGNSKVRLGIIQREPVLNEAGNLIQRKEVYRQAVASERDGLSVEILF